MSFAYKNIKPHWIDLILFRHAHIEEEEEKKQLVFTLTILEKEKGEEDEGLGRVCER